MKLKYKINPYGEIDKVSGVDITIPKNVIIPRKINGNKVTCIARNLFKNTEIEKIFIPNTVSFLYDLQFYGCKNLKSVVFEEGSQIKEIPPRCFEDAFDYGEIVIPDTVSIIKASAFKNAELSHIVFGSGLTTIQAEGFQGCRILKEIDLSNTNVDLIENKAFQYCRFLSAVILPNSIKFIGNFAFESCERLEFVYCNWENMNFIGDFCFKNTNIKSLDLSNFMGAIGMEAFKSSNINDLILNDFITDIGDAAFAGNYISLKEFKAPAFCTNKNIISGGHSS